MTFSNGSIAIGGVSRDEIGESRSPDYAYDRKVHKTPIFGRAAKDSSRVCFPQFTSLI